MPNSYYRTRGGFRVHRTACRHAVNGTPWLFAEGYTAAQISVLVGDVRYGMRPCLVCRPHEED